MLQSARQGLSSALPALRSSSKAAASAACFLILPAESSRQALLRYSSSSATRSRETLSSGVQPQLVRRKKAHGLATYSGAAVALGEERDDGYEQEAAYETEQSGRFGRWEEDARWIGSRDMEGFADDALIPSELRAGSTATASKRTVSETARSEISIDLFRSAIKSHPLHALHLLPRLPLRQRAELSLNQIDDLLKGLTELAKHNPDVVGESDRDRVQSLLAMIPDVLDSIAAANPDPAHHQRVSIALKNKRLVRFMRVCAYYGAIPLALDVWKEAVELQRRLAGQKIIMPDDIARVFSARKHWNTVLTMFSPPLFEQAWLTSAVLERYARALLVLGRPEDVPATFELHATAVPGTSLRPTSDSYAQLVQAHLSVGDIEQAKEVAARAKREGLLSEEQQQMAILRGHRSLGMDERMERRILDDLKRLAKPPDPAVLNMLIRLRLDAEHIEGARELLRYFDLERLGLPSRSPLRSGSIPANPETLKLAFNVIAKSDDLGMIRFVWHRLNELLSPIEDEHLLILVHALGRQGLQDEAYKIVRSIVLNKPEDCPVPLQSGFQVGVKSLNALLAVYAPAHGYQALERVTALFRKSRVQPDDYTVTAILDFAKYHGKGQAVDLAGLLVELLDSAPHLRPSMQHLDTIMSHAVTPQRQYTATSQSADLVDESPERELSEGIRIRSNKVSLNNAIKSIMQSLLERGRRSSSRTLATRLRFDAQRFTTGVDVPSPREIWATLIARGYQPDHRHLTALMRGYVESGHMLEAEEILELAGSHVGADAIAGMYRLLITGWGKVGDYARAHAAFAAVRNLPRGAGLPVITALIDAAYHCRHTATAAAIVHSEFQQALQREPLDARATHVAARALRSNGETLAALELIRRHGAAEMDKGLRLQVRGIRSWARKHLEEKRFEASLSPSERKERAEATANANANANAHGEGKPVWPLPSGDELERILSEAEALLREDDRLRPLHKRHVATMASKNGRKRLRRALRVSDKPNLNGQDGFPSLFVQ